MFKLSVEINIIKNSLLQIHNFVLPYTVCFSWHPVVNPGSSGEPEYNIFFITTLCKYLNYKNKMFCI